MPEEDLLAIREAPGRLIRELAETPRVRSRQVTAGRPAPFHNLQPEECRLLRVCRQLVLKQWLRSQLTPTGGTEWFPRREARNQKPSPLQLSVGPDGFPAKCQLQQGADLRFQPRR